MIGRSCLGLLVFHVLIVGSWLLPAQDHSGRATAATDESLAVPRLAEAVERALATTDAGRSDPTSTLRRPWPIAPGTLGFPQITRAAGTIFSGRVTAIARRPATRAQSVATVAVTFHVERAIRGATVGQDLTISQWIGLWSAGQRYRVGERVLLFLYPPSKLGLTSCVSGALGRFNVDALGRVLLSAQHLSAFQRDPMLGGKSRVDFETFALAARQAGGEQ
jgi:hypothetical protein